MQYVTVTPPGQGTASLPLPSPLGALVQQNGRAELGQLACHLLNCADGLILTLGADVLDAQRQATVPHLAAGLYVWLATPKCYILALLAGWQPNPKP
jgi:hypothetical protein